VDELLRVFASKGLDAGDLVALSGAHTVGFAHCIYVLGRIYDFRGTRRPDPHMDARLVKAPACRARRRGAAPASWCPST
jgi:peroxidase